MNSTVRPIFNEKVVEKWNLWVREQCTNALFTVENSTFVATVQWTVAALLPETREKKKKKREFTNADAALQYINCFRKTLQDWHFML